MIIDHRTYTIQHGRNKEYLDMFEKYGLPVQLRHLVNLVGYFQTAVGPLNQAIHLWRYEGFADMERRRAARDADPAWAEYRRMSVGLLVTQENKIITPVSFSPMK